jgi:prepilin-type N-terminal cleavage/methylation domain-containing protein
LAANKLIRQHFLKPSLGFTLTELAVVLVIVALLIGGMLIPFSAQQDLRYNAESQKSLQDIREALIGFAIANGRLPCPAQASLASNSTNAGMEAKTGTGSSLSCTCSTASSDISNAGSTTACTPTSVTGVLPWATLGLSELDAWGHRYTYRVSTVFARGWPQVSDYRCAPDLVPTRSAFALCSPGAITINSTSAGPALATEIPVIILTHGKNGLGAYSQDGTVIGSPAGDEAENTNDDAIYISNLGIDDLMIWVPPHILMNRMVTAGKLP